ncbi:MAG: polysaccharide pyruvyl transferase WcaK-like protein [Psychroserpens sp.]|jgi:polysaccharide pyruvyl transferase WcaK-like protein
MLNKKIFVHGSYYNKNFGDFLLIKRVVDELYPAQVKLPFANHSVIDEFDGLIDRIKFKDLQESELCIFGGGGYLGEPPVGITKWSLNFIRRHFVPFLILKLFNIKIKIIGAGLGPITKPWLKPFVRYMLKNSEVVMLRDKESILYANNLYPNRKYELTTDLAQDINFLNSLVSESASVISCKYLVVHIGLNVDKNIEDLIESHITDLIQSGFNILFISDSPGHDDNLNKNNFFCNKVVEAYPDNISKIPYKDSSTVINLIKNSSGIITGKLHVGIIACTYSLPVLSLPLHHKTIRYYEDIERKSCCILQSDNANVILKKVSLFFSELSTDTRTVLPEHVLKRHALSMDNIREGI